MSGGDDSMRDKRSRLYCDCGRILERYQHVCSECRQSNIDFAQDICNASMAHKKRSLEYYHKTKITRNEWRELACQS